MPLREERTKEKEQVWDACSGKRLRTFSMGAEVPAPPPNVRRRGRSRRHV